MNEKLGAAATKKDGPKKAVNPFASKDVLASRPKPRRAVAIESDGILQWPNGDVETETLGSILSEAHEKSLGNSAVVQFCKSKRIAGFDRNHPEWETVSRKTTVGNLKRWYKSLEGHDFDAEQHRLSHLNNRFAVYVYYNPEKGILDLVTVGQDRANIGTFKRLLPQMRKALA
jgi:hypothetical protein